MVSNLCTRRLPVLWVGVCVVGICLVFSCCQTYFYLDSCCTCFGNHYFSDHTWYSVGFVREPELRHQYSMLFNHHGYVVSGLKNLELFLSIELPKITDIQHTPPPFPNCNIWAVAPPSREDRYITSLGFSTGPSVMRQMENKNMTRFWKKLCTLWYVHTININMESC